MFGTGVTCRGQLWISQKARSKWHDVHVHDVRMILNCPSDRWIWTTQFIAPYNTIWNESGVSFYIMTLCASSGRISAKDSGVIPTYIFLLIWRLYEPLDCFMYMAMSTLATPDLLPASLKGQGRSMARCWRHCGQSSISFIPALEECLPLIDVKLWMIIWMTQIGKSSLGWVSRCFV